jgi:hypothetical protein
MSSVVESWRRLRLTVCDCLAVRLDLPSYFYSGFHRAGSSVNTGQRWTPLYFPMQKVPKMRFRMSSVVVAPVISSRGRKDA